ncbi:MAG: flavodoxin domain-containing protein [Chloroflexi bacterium]|nr:flavodoxin domain-containing protein [Chloroflexota bacterium]
MSLKALVIYFSPGGNTRKVAEAIVRGLERGGAQVTLLPLAEAEDQDYEGYDLVCLGAPSYHFNVPEPVLRYTKSRLSREREKVRLGAPTVPGRWAVVFVTYAGPHTGIDEATPAGDHMAQMFRHLGFEVRGIWYAVGEFHDDRSAENNLYGWLGDIRGRPNEHDLGVIESNAAGLAFVLDHLKRARTS